MTVCYFSATGNCLYVARRIGGALLSIPQLMKQDSIEIEDEAVGLIIGSPNYLGEMTASFRALYERLIFQNLTYNVEIPCCNDHMIPVLLIMTSNAPYFSYMGLLKNYQHTLNRFVGPTEIFVSGNTLQIKDYSKTDWEWSMFDPQAKQKRHEEVFPKEMKRVYNLSSMIFQ